MPTYPLTSDLSAPIAVAAGDIIQNHEPDLVEIAIGDPSADPARLRLPATTGAVKIEQAGTIRARMVGRLKTGTLHLIRGL